MANATKILRFARKLGNLLGIDENWSYRGKSTRFSIPYDPHALTLKRPAPMDYDSPQSVRTQWFQNRMDEEGHTVTSLSLILGVNKSSVSRFKNGQVEYLPSQINLLAKALNCSTSEMLRFCGMKPEENAPPARKIKIVGRLLDSGAIERSSDLGYVEADHDLAKDTVAVKSFTTGSLYSGAVYFYGPRKTVAKSALGRSCIVTLENGDELLRFVSTGASTGCYNLRDVAGKLTLNAKLKSAAIVSKIVLNAHN